MEVCEQETAAERKCSADLVVAKCGESPHRGGAGKLRNTCHLGWQSRPQKNRRRLHSTSVEEESEELRMTGVAPMSPKPWLIA